MPKTTLKTYNTGTPCSTSEMKARKVALAEAMRKTLDAKISQARNYSFTYNKEK